MEEADKEGWMNMRGVSGCSFFWYWLTGVVPDKIQRAMKWL